MTGSRVESRMRRQIAAGCVAALGLLALGSCAQPAGNVTAGSSASGVPTPSPIMSPSAPSPTPPSPTAAPSSTKPPVHTPPPGPKPSGTQMSLSGTIYSGAEPSCLLLRQGNVSYLLLAGDQMKLRAGVRAVVTGHVVHGIMTHCMQGQPFQVTHVDKLSPGN